MDSGDDVLAAGVRAAADNLTDAVNTPEAEDAARMEAAGAAYKSTLMAAVRRSTQTAIQSYARRGGKRALAGAKPRSMRQAVDGLMVALMGCERGARGARSQATALAVRRAQLMLAITMMSREPPATEQELAAATADCAMAATGELKAREMAAEIYERAMAEAMAAGARAGARLSGAISDAERVAAATAAVERAKLRIAAVQRRLRAATAEANALLRRAASR